MQRIKSSAKGDAEMASGIAKFFYIVVGIPPIAVPLAFSAVPLPLLKRKYIAVANFAASEMELGQEHISENVYLNC